jgi:hypothetical protein
VLQRQAYDPLNGLVFESSAWWLAMSRQPLKLWVTESSLLDDAWTSAVFSAVP